MYFKYLFFGVNWPTTGVLKQSHRLKFEYTSQSCGLTTGQKSLQISLFDFHFMIVDDIYIIFAAIVLIGTQFIPWLYHRSMMIYVYHEFIPCIGDPKFTIHLAGAWGSEPCGPCSQKEAKEEDQVGWVRGCRGWLKLMTCLPFFISFSCFTHR